MNPWSALVFQGAYVSVWKEGPLIILSSGRIIMIGTKFCEVVICLKYVLRFYEEKKYRLL